MLCVDIAACSMGLDDVLFIDIIMALGVCAGCWDRWAHLPTPK